MRAWYDVMQARNISITVRTLIQGLSWLATFIFSANAVGLLGELPCLTHLRPRRGSSAAIADPAVYFVHRPLCSDAPVSGIPEGRRGGPCCQESRGGGGGAPAA